MTKEKKIQKTTQELLKKLLVEAKVEVSRKEEMFTVSIDVKDPALLIGHGGETLTALEQILRLLINSALGEFTYILVDVAGYKDKRRQDLEDIAKRYAVVAKKTKRAQLLSPMNSYERRVIHMILSSDEEIETESVGGDPNRRVMIKTKKTVTSNL